MDKALTTKTQHEARTGSLAADRSSKHSKHNQFPPKPKSFNFSSTKRQTISEAQHTEKGVGLDAAETEMMTHEVSHFDYDFTSTRRILEINRHLKTCEAVAHRQHNSFLQVSVYPKTV